jgi:NAD(P)-dependent dehydrogenase (short-subunit alcohol dehydrogenase family)
VPVTSLEGKSALVTGGASGIGRAITAALAAAGCEVLVADSSPESLEATKARLAVATRRCDFARAGEVEEMFDSARTSLGRLDILVICHARRPAPTLLLDTAAEAYEAVRSTVMDSTFVCLREGGRRMVEQGGGGRIVVVSIGRGSASGTDGSAYDASRSATLSLVGSAAAELGASGITVNSVVAGRIRSEMTEAETDSAVGSPGAATGLGEPDDAARAVLWFVDPDNAYVNGSSLVVDGGAAATGSP